VEDKLVLFTAACFRRIWHLLPDERSRRLVERTEISNREEWAGWSVDVAAGEEAVSASPSIASRIAARAAVEFARGARKPLVFGYSLEVEQASVRRHWDCPRVCAEAAVKAVGHADQHAGGMEAERQGQVALLRDVFGNPFRRPSVEPSWGTPAVLALARSMFEERQFREMPVLGDALEEADCTDEQLLFQCRQPAEHVRGCWVLDLLLGKT
jgi:hypothetical protein